MGVKAENYRNSLFLCAVYVESFSLCFYVDMLSVFSFNAACFLSELKRKHNFLGTIVDQRHKSQRTAYATMLTFICTIEAQLTEVIFLPPNFPVSVIHSFSAKVEE